MNNYFLFIILIPVLYFFNYFFVKNKILIDQIESSQHKKFLNVDSVPLSGGVFIYLSVIFFLKDLNYLDKILFSIIFFIGLLSDLQKLKSPIIRLFLQFFIVLAVLILNKNLILQTRLSYLDYLLENIFIIKILFTLFCILILMNGVNFIDGVNGLSAGYFLVILLNIFIISKKYNILIEYNDLIILGIFLTVFLIFNLFSMSFLGDGGCYLLSVYFGLFLISFSNLYQNIISPYYICLLLWYPAFENFFSILRRKFVKKGFSTYADNEHIHHFLFKFLNKKIKISKLSNSLSGIIINLFNFSSILIGSSFINNTKVLSLIIISSVCFYLFIYFVLKKITISKNEFSS